MLFDLPLMDLPQLAGPYIDHRLTASTRRPTSRPQNVKVPAASRSSVFDEEEHDAVPPQGDEEGDRVKTSAQTACCNPIMKMTQSAFRECMQTLTRRRPEAGGMLLGPEDDDDLVTHYVHDKNGRATSTSFTLDAAGLNRVLARFRRCRMNCKGLLHSHPCGITRPSHGDLKYVTKSFANPSNDNASQFFLPIVCDEKLYPYVIIRDAPGCVLVAQLLLV